ncbi:type 3 dihydrofolate reductase [Teredinibacter turnerae]|uniref:type 3 dihydrofolate reductase n=1 Tax=Teredinibacter turnerae TaxID=2426 RepID=UPI000374A97D|nr:type 3 dihydrofolate reductase [Teredinibacter turnerae]
MTASDEISVALVVGVAANGVIGRDNGLPWRLPKDLAYFKRVTMGHPIVMGRKTFDSIGRPLPGRTNIVVTRNPTWQAEGVDVCHSLEDALVLARDVATQTQVKQIMVIGGAEFYRQMLPQADRLYLTEVHADVVGDAYFPEFDRSRWQQLSAERHEADSGNPYAYSFLVLERR